MRRHVRLHRSHVPIGCHRCTAGVERHPQNRCGRDALRQLDDRPLHDLGIDRDEIGSIAAQLTGAAECTRHAVLEYQIGFWNGA